MKKTKKKLNKNSLRKDSVTSDTIHVGIELELIAPCYDGNEHDDESCRESYEECMREDLRSMSTRELIERLTGHNIPRDAADTLSDYLDRDAMIDSELESIMYDWFCVDYDCGHHSNNGNDSRESLESDLIDLTENKSIKVVSDSSINHDSDETDAEVCWNYYISKETVNDNTLIINHLNEQGLRFNTSCGLHINLNNYLNIEHSRDIPTSELSFLFNLVAPSRRKSGYCNINAIADKKYSMLFNQKDRIEFRFFSPTLNPKKLNHYVTLAHHIYKRLAGIDSKLPKKSLKFFETKMIEAGHPKNVVFSTLKKVNSIKSYKAMADALPIVTEINQEEVA